MLALSLAFIGMDVLLLKYCVISFLDSIQVSRIMATFATLIDLAIKLIFGWFNS